MAADRQLAAITLADLIVRSAYQMGKTPLLPLFALALGASDEYLGLIVSVSTLTGMVLKPWIGLLSDCFGRRRWLLFGTAFFALVPFVYGFVKTPEQLFSVRIVHGLATAIYGPVTLAYVAEHSATHRAERLGWFSMARTAGYIVGPAASGWLLLSLDPVHVFTLIGLFSCLAFVPVLLVRDSRAERNTQRPPLRKQVLDAFNASGRVPAVWLAGGLEAAMYVALYALKAFLPVYALSAGLSVALIGVFFAAQEMTHLILKPWGGRLADRVGHLLIIAAGMLILSLTLPVVTILSHDLLFLLPAVLLGLSEALIMPSSVALASHQLHPDSVGTGMGLIGMLKNAGKVAGPVMAGFLIGWIGFESALNVIAAMLLIGATVLLSRDIIHRRKLRSYSTQTDKRRLQA